jgi:hypothetical protein
MYCRHYHLRNMRSNARVGRPAALLSALMPRFSSLEVQQGISSKISYKKGALLSLWHSRKHSSKKGERKKLACLQSAHLSARTAWAYSRQALQHWGRTMHGAWLSIRCSQDSFGQRHPRSMPKAAIAAKGVGQSGQQKSVGGSGRTPLCIRYAVVVIVVRRRKRERERTRNEPSWLRCRDSSSVMFNVVSHSPRLRAVMIAPSCSSKL